MPLTWVFTWFYMGFHGFRVPKFNQFLGTQRRQQIPRSPPGPPRTPLAPLAQPHAAGPRDHAAGQWWRLMFMFRNLKFNQ